MPQPKFKESFYKATPHLFDSEILVLTKKSAASAKDKALVQVDEDTFLNVCTTPPHKWQAFCDYLAKNGQLDPILVDEQGYVLDGFATWFALTSLKVAAKDVLIKVVTQFKTDADKLTWMRSRKLARATLTESQRIELVKAEIKAHPERGNNLQAQLLGVDHKTVAKYRQELEALGPKHGGIEWFAELLGANGRKDKNPGKKHSAKPHASQSARAITNAFAEAVKYQEMMQTGISIPDIADMEGKTSPDVLDTVGILDLNKEKQEQIKQGKLDPKKAVQAQSRLMSQAVHELPNHALLPKRIAPTSELFLSSLVQIKDFIDHLADMNLTAYLPGLKQAITQMAENFAKDVVQVEKALKEQRTDWNAPTQKAKPQKAEPKKAQVDVNNAKGKATRGKVKGKERIKVKLALLPDRDLVPSHDQKMAAK
jgi:hypothetical protein